MKKSLLLLAVLAATTTFGQSKWSFLTLGEESIHVTDVRPSYYYLNLDVPAGNGGVRFGFHRAFNEKFGADVSLGITGMTSPSRFATTIIPLEFIGHYNIMEYIKSDYKGPNAFNADFGFGSALARPMSATYNTGGRFSFSENVSLGVSYDFKNLMPGGVFSIGYRHTIFVDDYLDTEVSGSTPDMMARVFLSTRFNFGNSPKAQADLARATERADRLGAELAAAEAKAKELERKAAEASRLERELKEAQQALADSTAAWSEERAKAPATTEATEKPASTGQGYAIIVGSFSTKAGARELVDELGGGARVIAVPELDRFRVAYDVYSNYGTAKEKAAELKDSGMPCWIVKL